MNPFWMAPMAGVTDAAFRVRLRRNGCTKLFTEMISAAALARGNRRTAAYLSFPDFGDDLAVQLFGADPAELAEGAQQVAALGVRHLDFNMGCPVKKVVRTGAGAALMLDLGRAERCISALRRAFAGFLSVKMRAGWDLDRINCAEAAAVAEACGADAVVLHPRTRAQGYSGLADWSRVEEVAARVSIPLVGNGDIGSGSEAVERLRSTGCAAVMIGRAALGQPWIFRDAWAHLGGGRSGEAPDPAEIGQDLLLQMEDQIRWKGRRSAAVEMRKFAAWAARGLPGAAHFRAGLQDAGDTEILRDRILGFFGRATAAAVS